MSHRGRRTVDEHGCLLIMRPRQATARKAARFQLLVCAAVALAVGSVADGPHGYSHWLGQSGGLDWRVASDFFDAALQPEARRPVGIAGTRG